MSTLDKEYSQHLRDFHSAAVELVKEFAEHADRETRYMRHLKDTQSFEHARAEARQDVWTTARARLMAVMSENALSPGV